jgi:hypothetical protein
MTDARACGPSFEARKGAHLRMTWCFVEAAAVASRNDKFGVIA